MKQINHSFADYYYLTECGQVYNSKTDQYIQADINHKFKLSTIDNYRKTISLKPLYKLVYGIPYCKDNIQNLHGEQWKEVYGTDKIYYVSNMGRVKSYYGYTAKILKPFKNKGGYLRVDILEHGKRVTKLVHRLVAAAFLPAPKHIDMQLHHKDFNKDNNAANNLQWLSSSEHSKKHCKGDIENVSSKSKENIDRKNK